MRIYSGLSSLNGKAIQAIATNLDRTSKNPKTGDMVQLYIVPQRVNPVTAQRTGYDAAVCGDCPLRPSTAVDRKALCYVTTIHGPNATWKAHKGHELEWPSVITKPVRLGAYGDPAAVPARVWRKLLKGVRRWTGYSHQWNKAKHQDLRSLVMASVDSPDQARKAWAKGWRTFRAKAAEAPLLPGEITCPASAEAGQRTTCAECGLCNGSQGANDRRKSIAINYH